MGPCPEPCWAAGRITERNRSSSTPGRGRSGRAVVSGSKSGSGWVEDVLHPKELAEAGGRASRAVATDCLNGMRVLSMVWIVLGHTMMMPAPINGLITRRISSPVRRQVEGLVHDRHRRADRG